MGAVLAIATMIIEYPVTGLSALWHYLFHYQVSRKTLMDKPESQVEKQGKGITGAVEVEDNYNDERYETHVCYVHSSMFNSTAFDALEWRRPILHNVMEALGDPNTDIIGVYGLDDGIKDTLLQRVSRRVARDKLFDVVLIATVTKKPNVRKIQEEIAGQLEFSFNEKSESKRATELLDRIKKEQKILIMLCDLYKRLDLGKVGIPFGADHIGCKILLFSTSEEVLSNQMHAQKIFMV